VVDATSTGLTQVAQPPATGLTHCWLRCPAVQDDGMIGLEGAPRSAAECWEGIGSCAIGSRRLG
jgi:hypothetical protein